MIGCDGVMQSQRVCHELAVMRGCAAPKTPGQSARELHVEEEFREMRRRRKAKPVISSFMSSSSGLRHAIVVLGVAAVLIALWGTALFSEMTTLQSQIEAERVNQTSLIETIKYVERYALVLE